MATRFGTTSDMIIQPVEENGQAYLLAIDSKGLYLTTQSRLDNSMADPNRFTGVRAGTASRLSALGLDPEGLLNDNKHLVQLPAKEATRKVNPLKASKRASKG